jgi:hypothetical protein
MFLAYCELSCLCFCYVPLEIKRIAFPAKLSAGYTQNNPIVGATAAKFEAKVIQGTVIQSPSAMLFRETNAR